MALKRIVCLASGRGSNFAAIADAVKKGRVKGAEVVGLIANVPGAPVLALAGERRIPTAVVDSSAYRAGGKLERDRYEAAVVEKLDAFSPDLICLAGYMLLLGPRILKRWPNRILNIHPSLLPAFPGLHAQRQALAAGVKITGCTVHLVNHSLDAGPILLQTQVEVKDGDTEETLSQRILGVEHPTYVAALNQICNRPHEVRDNEVFWLD